MKREAKLRALRVLAILFAVGLFVFGAIFAAVCIEAGRPCETRQSDCIIVLGARVLPDGELSDALRVRCEGALQAWQSGLAPVIICCGSRGSDEPISEAEAMRDWFLEHGVPDAEMVVEDASTDTRSSLRNACVIMASRGFGTAAVSTSDYHMRRTLWMARDEGIDACGISVASSSRAATWVRSRLRETCCWMLYWLGVI